MSLRRTTPGGWVDLRSHPKGPTGRGLCRFCSAEVPKGRLTFCGVRCVFNWKLRTQPAFLREQVFRRDRGVCAACGVDTMHGVLRPRARGTGDRWACDHILPVAEGGGETGLENMQTLCPACHTRKTNEQRRRAAEARKQNDPRLRTPKR